MMHFWTWTHNGMMVVTTPDFVDVSNEKALPVLLRGAAAVDSVVIVDATTCDTFFGVNAMRTLDDAAAAMAGEGGELRIAITNPKRREHLELYVTLAHSDRHLRIFDDLRKALAATRLDRKPQLQPQAA